MRQLLVIALVLTGLGSLLSAQAAEFLLWPNSEGAYWTSHRTEERVNTEFSHYALTTNQEGAAIWQFGRQPGQPNFADTFLDIKIERPFSELGVTFRLQGAPITLAMKVRDAGGAEYAHTFGPIQPAEDAQTVTMGFDELEFTTWGGPEFDNRITFPLTSLAIIAFEVPENQPVELTLERIWLEPMPAPLGELTGFELPSSLEPGQVVPLAGKLKLLTGWPFLSTLKIQLQGPNGSVFGTELAATAPEWPAGTILELNTDLTVPAYPWTGEYKPALTLDGVPIELESGELPLVSIIGPKGGTLVEAEVKPLGGNPGLFVNGKPSSGLVYMTYNLQAQYVRQFGEQAVHLYSFAATSSSSHYNLAADVWLGPDEWDYSQLDQRIETILEQDPEAYIFPRVYITSPRWWNDQHPEDLVQSMGPDDVPVLMLDSMTRAAPSFASKAFREDMGMALRRFIQHCQEAPWAERIIGYHVASGTTEEWMYWGANDGKFCDYSPVAVEAFRTWLTAKYGTDEALQKAWGDPAVTLATAQVPSYSKRVAAEAGELRNPAVAQDCVDNSLFLSDITVDTILHFAHIVKDETDGKGLFGTFYGYVMQLIAEPRQQNAGHLALQRLWNSPDLDFLTSPTSYMFRSLDDTSYVHFMSLTDSVKLHSKLWIDENDIRTFKLGEAPGWGFTDNYEDTLAMQQREFAAVMGASCGMWWFDMGGGWYDDEQLLGKIGEMNAIGEELKLLPRGDVDEIAVVVDDASLAYLRINNAASASLLNLQLPELGRIGAPLGYYHIKDLPKLERHKLFLFLDCFKLDKEDLAAIDHIVKQPGKVAVWYFAPGLITEQGFSEAAMRKLTGLPLSYEVVLCSPQLAWTPEGAALSGKQPGELLTGGRDWQSRVTCEAEVGEVLATYAGGGGPGLVLEEQGGFTSVWCGTGPLPARLLHQLALRAGVHCYAPPGDLLWANESVVGLWSAAGGPKEVSLPHPAAVKELFSGTDLGEGTVFQLELPAKGTALLLIEPL